MWREPIFLKLEVYSVKIGEANPLVNILFCAFKYPFVHNVDTLISYMAQP